MINMIDHKVTPWGEVPTVGDNTDWLRWIEKAGRTCYKSDHKISDTSYNKFVYNIWKSGHGSVLEHSNLVIRSAYHPGNPMKAKQSILAIIGDNDFINVHIDAGHVYVGGNFRAWAEMMAVFPVDNSVITTAMNMLKNILVMFKDICFGNKFIVINNSKDVPVPLKMFTYHLLQDRAFLAEITRHRVDIAFSVESQRYVNYEEGVAFIKPYWYDKADLIIKEVFINSLAASEHIYKRLVKEMKPQAARGVLPNATATQIIMTATAPEWGHIMHLRRAGGAHPDMRRAMNHVYDWIISNSEEMYS